MEYYDQEYLKLFKQVNEQNTQQLEVKNYNFEQLRGNNNNDYSSSEMLKETPSYSNYNQQNINEVQLQNYNQSYNLNEFNIETRINGQNINEIRKQEKEDRLNEVMQKLREERLAEIKKEEESHLLNETVNFSNVDYVSLEMFDKARYNSMMQIAQKIKSK